MTQEPTRGTGLTRRFMLAGAGVAGLMGVVAGCGTLRNDAIAAAQGEAAEGKSTLPPSSMAPGASAAGGTAAQAGGTTMGSGVKVLAATSEIPVGGGVVFTSAKVVVTQPKAGEFKAFSAVCTHLQCLVDKVAMGRIDCPCHGSQFSAKNGAVEVGPAQSPLPAVKIKVEGGKISLA